MADIFDNGRAPVKVKKGGDEKPEDEEQLLKLMRRIAALRPGRYELVLTVSPAGVEDWTVEYKGKVEK